MKLHLSKPQWLGVSLLILLVMLVLIEHLLYGGDPAKQDLNRALAAPVRVNRWVPITMGAVTSHV